MKHTSKLFALLLALAMIVSTFSISFAAKPKVYQAKDIQTFLMASQKMVKESMFTLPDEESGVDVDVSDRYQTGRIMVCPGKELARSFLKDTSDAISFKGWYFLQYDSEQATKDAYKALKAAYGADNVILDKVFQVPLSKTVEAKKLVQKNDYMSWGIRNMGLDKVQEKLERRPNKPQVTVAVLDSGVNLLESAFAQRIVNPMDLVLFNPFPYDFNGHGTHCISTLIDGTPSNVKIMPVKTITGLGFGTIFNTLYGLLYAEFMCADIINMSLAAEDQLEIRPYDSLLRMMVEEGKTIVVAAGNEAMDVKYSYPSSSEFVITVGSINKKNRVEKDYSNYGDAVDFVAPGSKILGYATDSGIPAKAYMTGTSMATPHVTAACALIKTEHPDYNQKKIYKVLKNNAIDSEA